MKQISFTNSETSLLLTFLKRREMSNSESFGKDPRRGRHFNFYIKPVISVQEKLLASLPCRHTPREKSICISCVNENYDDVLKELKLSNALSWLSASKDQRQVINKLDDCRNILVKCGYAKRKYSSNHFDPDFRYGKFLVASDNLKAAETILLSKVGENDIYRIAFVHQERQYAIFELKNQISWRDFQFSPLPESLESLERNKFSMRTDRKTAKSLIASVDPQRYPKGVLECVNLILQ
jgi:hypothetical protein